MRLLNALYRLERRLCDLCGRITKQINYLLALSLKFIVRVPDLLLSLSFLCH